MLDFQLPGLLTAEGTLAMLLRTGSTTLPPRLGASSTSWVRQIQVARTQATLIPKSLRHRRAPLNGVSVEGKAGMDQPVANLVALAGPRINGTLSVLRK